VCILFATYALAKNNGFHLQSLSPVWFGKENIRVFPIFSHTKGEGNVTLVPYLIKTVDEGVEVVLLHPLNNLIDTPLTIISFLIGWRVEGPGVTFNEHWGANNFGWFFLIKNKETFAFRFTPLFFYHNGNIINSKYFKSLNFRFLPEGSLWEGPYKTNVISSFPIFHISNTTMVDKSDVSYQNISILWFLYWHWKVEESGKVNKTSHFLIFF